MQSTNKIGAILKRGYDVSMEAHEPIHCCKEDEELFSLFSDTYKDFNGSRPRGFYTKAQVKDWMEHFSRLAKLELQEQEIERSIKERTHKAFQPSPAGFSLANAFA